ncbi:hypothetical protein [Bdellovibrio svalbardensis]|uniref:Uncharacterized protein n=1 Tax=Bdellovibrio svalbardensis TaxID=2972972 RepID=A0ABT6DK29_9BACT|nr:hypothetical protein [Bdellovibrio svalbardensis]MDG0816274.1 hypothetical protein [Bdellovibrio svalbardensis]
MRISSLSVIFVLLLGSIGQAAPVFKYFLNDNDLIAEKCTDDGETISSKISMSFAVPAEDVVETQLRVKACTHKYGLKKLTFSFALPLALFDESLLLQMPIEKAQKIGKVWVTREANLKGKAVFSLSPESFGSKADGVSSIRYFVAMDESERHALLEKTQGRFVWSGLSIVYKKGFLMPTVNLRGDLTVVEEE